MIAANIATLKEGRPQVVDSEGKSTAQIGAVSEIQAARLMNVGKRSVQKAKKVRRKGAPEVVAAVEHVIPPMRQN